MVKKFDIDDDMFSDISFLQKHNYSDVKSLIFDIELYLNDSLYPLDDLESVSQFLSEYNYYNNTNK